MYHSHIEESNILFPSEYIDGQFYDTSFISLLEIVKDSGVYIDLLSCNLRDQAFVDEMVRLSSNYGLTIRYSLDLTGNSPNGNWILESHSVDAKDIYFTENISNFTEVLSLEKYPYTVMFNLNFDVNEELVHYERNYNGDKLNCLYDSNANLLKFPPSSIYSDISGYDTSITNAVAIIHNSKAACALLEDGTIHVWGSANHGGSLTSEQLSSITDVVSIYSSELGFLAKKTDGSFIIWGNGAFNITSTEINTQLNGEGIKYAASRTRGTTWWGFYLITTSGKLIQFIINGSTNELYDTENEDDSVKFIPASDLYKVSSNVVSIQMGMANNNVSVLKSNGEFHMWGEFITDAYQFRENVSSIKSYVANCGLVYQDGLVEGIGSYARTVAQIQAKLISLYGSGLQSGEKFIYMMPNLHGISALTNQGKFITFGDTRADWGFGKMEDSERSNLNTIFETDPIKRIFKGDGYIIFLTESKKLYSYGGTRNIIRSLSSYSGFEDKTFEYAVCLEYGQGWGVNSMKYVAVESNGNAFVVDHKHGANPFQIGSGSSPLAGFGLMRQDDLYAIFNDGSVYKALYGQIQSALQNAIHISDNFLTRNIFALINADASVRGYNLNIQLFNESNVERFGGLTESEISGKISDLGSISPSNNVVSIDSSKFNSDLSSLESFNTESHKRLRLRKSIQSLKSKVIAKGISLGSTNRIRVPRTSLSFPNIFRKDFFQIADNNVIINISDIGDDCVYASLENENDYLRVNTANSYITITNTGSDTYSVDLGGTVSTGVVEGTTGEHDDYQYHVGSGAIGPAEEPICFFKGSLIPMADGSQKKVEDIKEGDLVKTEMGSGEVIKTKKWKFSTQQKDVLPYTIDNLVMVSGNHMVKKNGKLNKAKEIGQKVIIDSEYVEYYHFQTKNYLVDMIPYGDTICVEVWDGADWNKCSYNYLWFKPHDPNFGYQKYVRIEL